MICIPIKMLQNELIFLVGTIGLFVGFCSKNLHNLGTSALYEWVLASMADRCSTSGHHEGDGIGLPASPVRTSMYGLHPCS